MIKRGFVLSALLFLGAGLISFSATTANLPGLLNAPTVRYRIQIPAGASRTQVTNVIRLLNAAEFDVAGIDLNSGSIDVVTTAEGLAFLERKGLKGQIISYSTLSPDKRYLNAATIGPQLQALQQTNPQLSRIVEIGKSNQGRPVLAMLISSTLDFNSPEYHQKPTIIFDGLHHAREVMTPEIVMDVGEVLLKNQASRPAQEILKNWNVWIIPMLNPDGSNIVFNSNSMWRKNAHADANNIYGVDINRNYSYRWAQCNGSSGNKGSDTYRGASANSEPEIQAITKLADQVHPTASLSYHSYSELVLYPYGCQGDLTSENALIQKIANELAAQLPTDRGDKHYSPGTPWQLLYSVDGSSMDYMYAIHGALAYTFEVNTDFQPKYEVKAPTLLKHRKAWTYFLYRASQNLLTLNIVDGKTNKPVEALIGVDTIKLSKGETPFHTNRFGKYFKVLDPGTYNIIAKLADGRTGQLQVVMTGNPQMMTLTVP